MARGTKVAPVFEISTVNLMVGWCEFACVMNLSITGLLTSHNENFSSTYRFQIIGFMTLLLRIYVSRTAIKIFAKATSILVPMAVRRICRYFFPLKCKDFSLSMS